MCQRVRRRRSRHQEDPWSPLSVELEEVMWSHHLKAAILPQYEGESDLREFLLKYEATMESNGGGSAIKAKAFVMIMKGPAQHWYASFPIDILMEPTEVKTINQLPRSEGRRANIM